MGCPIEIIPIPLDDFLQDLMLWVPEELRSKFTSGLARSIKFVANCSFPNFLLCSGGDLNPILGFCFPLFSRCFPGEFPSG